MRKRNNAQKCLHAVFFLHCVCERERGGGRRESLCMCMFRFPVFASYFIDTFPSCMCLFECICIRVAASVCVSVRKARQARALHFDSPGTPARNKSPPWVQ